MNKGKFGIITIITLFFALSLLIVSKTNILSNLGLAYDGINHDNIENVINDIENGHNTLIFDNTSRAELNYFIDYIYDSPDLFWISMRYTSLSLGNVSVLSINNKYDDVESKKQFIENELDKIIKNVIKDGMSDFDKTLAIHDWICDNITYGELNNDGDQEIYGSLKYKKSRCAGYAKLFTSLLEKVGIDSDVISGDAIDKDGNTIAHAWNIVTLDGCKYYFDVTWNDHDTDEPTYYWFAVTSKEFKNKHFPNDGYEWLETVDTENNYFVKNNMFLDRYNYASIVSQIQKQGKIFTIKCKNRDVFQQTTKALNNKDELQKIMKATGITYIEQIVYEEEPATHCLKIAIK